MDRHSIAFEEITKYFLEDETNDEVKDRHCSDKMEYSNSLLMKLEASIMIIFKPKN